MAITGELNIESLNLYFVYPLYINMARIRYVEFRYKTMRGYG